MTTSRRNFLRGAGALPLLASGGIAATLSNFAAHAIDVTGYKALVCVFLKGGLDNHDTIIPFDTASYNRYAEIREDLVDDTPTRERNLLLELNPVNGAAFGSRRFALPPELGQLHALFESGAAAIVGNVGPLVEPTTQTQFRERSVSLPPRLFSHNDQQSTWMALSPEGARIGWGGQFADRAILANANATPAFTAVATGSTDVFLAGEIAQQYRNQLGGPASFRELEQSRLLGEGRRSEIAPDLLREHFRAQSGARSNLFEQDIAAISQRSVDVNEQYVSALETTAPVATTFPDTRLGRQLAAVAETIALRSQLGISRQVFFVTIGGFDTHSGQAGRLPGLQIQIAEAIAAFYNATIELGVRDSVTTFTASDFGRTLNINGDGTDHGWGAHHFVVGGAVDGQTIFGDLPVSDFDHAQDAGNGRLIPTTSVEQYAASLGRWFGLNDTELMQILPGLQNFPSGPPPFV